MRKRNISIPIRVTEKELSVIDRKAARARLTRTEYLITCALGKEITLIEDLKPILADLRRVGNNLNQLTRLANMGKIQDVNLGECRAALEQTYTAIHTLAKRRNAKTHCGEFNFCSQPCRRFSSGSWRSCRIGFTKRRR